MGILRKSGRIWISSVCLLLFVKGISGLLRFPLQRPGPERSFVVNASFVSPRCAAKYTCSSGTQDVYECSCHPHCSLLDTCCHDVRPCDWQLRAEGTRDVLTCVSAYSFTAEGLNSFSTNFGYYYSIYMVNKCPTQWGASPAGRLCLHALEQTNNGTLSLPVTDSFTGLTYRNVFCAACNGKSVADVQEWIPFYSCNTLGSEVPPETCPMAYSPPMDAALHSCHQSYIDRCPENTTSSSEDICSSSATQYVYDTINRIVYRNWNCTLCSASTVSAVTECTHWPLEPVYIQASPSFNYPADIQRDYHCPSSLSGASQQELRFWADVCPGMSSSIYDA